MIDIKKHFFIEPKNIEQLQIARNPFSKTQQWLLDDKYILRKTEQKPNDRILRELDKAGVPVLEPIGNTIEQDGYYQLHEYIPCSGRLDYENIKQAEIIGKMLGRLANVKNGNIIDIREPVNKISCCTPDAKAAAEYLDENLYPFMSYMELRFSHGDLHPANMLWQNDELTVIDWEVAGIRPELYDAAFLLGCVGMDNPNNLKSPWAKELLQSVRASKPTKLSFSLLPEMMLASRIGWLYIWQQRSQDADVFEQEKKYITIIMDNIEDIRQLWLSWAGEFKRAKSRWFMQDAHLTGDIEAAKARIPAEKGPEQEATDTRLLAIDAGMKDDILSLISHIEKLKHMAKKYPENRHVQVEAGIAFGNMSLDMSKFSLFSGMDYLKEMYHEHQEKNQGIDEIKTGYAFLLRNISIMLAEAGSLERSFETVDEQIEYAKDKDEPEIKGELARTLSNAITTCLENRMLDKVDGYWDMLKGLNDKFKTEKVNVAYRVAETNLNKAYRQKCSSC